MKQQQPPKTCHKSLTFPGETSFIRGLNSSYRW